MHGHGFAVEYVVFDCRQGVGKCADADTLDIGCVVARAAVVIIFAPLNAVVNEYGHEGGWHPLGVEAFDNLIAADFDIDEVIELGFVGVEELLEGGKGFGPAGFGSELEAGSWVLSVVEGQFKDFGPVAIAGEGATFFSKGADFDAAAGSAAAGVEEGFSVVEHFPNDDIRIENGGLAESGANDLAGAFEEAVGIFCADLNAAAGLNELHFFDDVKNEIGYVVYGILSGFGVYAADVDEGEIGIGSALFFGNADFGGCGLVVEFNPEALEEFACLLGGECAGFEFFFVKRVQMLIETARVVGIPDVQVCDYTEMDKPVGLEGFPECSGGIGGHVPADGGDFFQFLLADGVGLPGGQLFGFFGIAASEGQDGVDGQFHSLKFLLFAEGLGVVQEVQFAHGFCDVILKIEQSFAVDFVIEDGVSGCPLLHKLGKDSGFEGAMPVFAHGGEELLPHGFALPEGDDSVCVNLFDFVADVKGGSAAACHDFKIFEGVAAQFGVGIGCFGCGASFADNEFSVVDADVFAAHDVLKGQAADDGCGLLHGDAALIEVCNQFSPFGADVGFGVDALCPQFCNSFVHFFTRRFLR